MDMESPRPAARCTKCGSPAYDASTVGQRCSQPMNSNNVHRQCDGTYRRVARITHWKVCERCHTSGKQGGNYCTVCCGLGWIYCGTDPAMLPSVPRNREALSRMTSRQQGSRSSKVADRNSQSGRRGTQTQIIGADAPARVGHGPKSAVHLFMRRFATFAAACFAGLSKPFRRTARLRSGLARTSVRARGGGPGLLT